MDRAASPPSEMRPMAGTLLGSGATEYALQQAAFTDEANAGYALRRIYKAGQRLCVTKKFLI